MAVKKNDWLTAVAGFGLSIILTWLFIESYRGYISLPQMALSGAIAGGKWAIQLSLAWVLLGDQKWRYYREMGVICATGSMILVPYILSPGDGKYFLASLIACVAVMAVLICWKLPRIGVTKFWVLLWLGLLAIAVTLQLTVVFNVL